MTRSRLKESKWHSSLNLKIKRYKKSVDLQKIELIILEFFSFLYNLEIGVANKSFKISLKFYVLWKYIEIL